MSRNEHHEIIAAILTAGKLGSDDAHRQYRKPEEFVAEYRAMLTALKNEVPNPPAGGWRE